MTRMSIGILLVLRNYIVHSSGTVLVVTCVRTSNVVSILFAGCVLRPPGNWAIYTL